MNSKRDVDGHATPDGPNAGFTSQSGASFEPIIVRWLCEPLLALLPRSIAPNAISSFNHLICWSAFGCAAASAHLGPEGRFAALVVAGALIFASMIGDCLDGMQARRTGRTSKLGELLDHGLDALHIVLASAGLVLALQLPPWASVLVVVSTAAVYNAQLISFHHGGVFASPPISGTEAQFSLSATYIGAALLLLFVDRSDPWLDFFIIVFAVLSSIVQIRLAAFFFSKFDKLVPPHLAFLAICGVWAGLHMTGWISAVTFALAIAFTSLRINGSYVLFSVVKRGYGGVDWTLAALALAIAAAALVGKDLGLDWGAEIVSLDVLTPIDLAVGAVCIYVVGRSFSDVRRYWRFLRM